MRSIVEKESPRTQLITSFAKDLAEPVVIVVLAVFVALTGREL